MAAYATVAELALRWRPLSTDELPIAQQLLADAAVIIDEAADVSSLSADILSIVSCDMVRRAMCANGDSFALGSYEGDYTDGNQAWTPLEANGSVANGLWLTYANRKLLKIYAGRYYAVPPIIGYEGGF